MVNYIIAIFIGNIACLLKHMFKIKNRIYYKNSLKNVITKKYHVKLY